MSDGNPVSEAARANNPEAEAEFYMRMPHCETVGELFDLVFRVMHVEGRGKIINWKLLLQRIRMARDI